MKCRIDYELRRWIQLEHLAEIAASGKRHLRARRILS